jgi:hypothetical protein
LLRVVFVMGCSSYVDCGFALIFIGLLLWIVVKEWGFDVGNGVWCSGQAWVLGLR